MGKIISFHIFGSIELSIRFPTYVCNYEFLSGSSGGIVGALCDYNDETLVPNNLVCRAQEKSHARGTERQVSRRRDEDRSSSQSQASPTSGGIQVAYSA